MCPLYTHPHPLLGQGKMAAYPVSVRDAFVKLAIDAGYPLLADMMRGVASVRFFDAQPNSTQLSAADLYSNAVRLSLSTCSSSHCPSPLPLVPRAAPTNLSSARDDSPLSSPTNPESSRNAATLWTNEETRPDARSVSRNAALRHNPFKRRGRSPKSWRPSSN